jgi:hypothetical protein
MGFLYFSKKRKQNRAFFSYKGIQILDRKLLLIKELRFEVILNIIAFANFDNRVCCNKPGAGG